MYFLQRVMVVVFVLFFTSVSYATDIKGSVVSLQTVKDVNTSGLTNLELQKFNESLVVSSKNKGLFNALVYINKVSDSNSSDKAKPVRLDQINNIFAPRVVPMKAGGEMKIVNSDKVFHNVHAYFRGENLFIDNLPDYKQETKHTIDREGVVSMKCEVHLNMQAYVVVLQNSFFASTGEDGSFIIKDVPSGKYELTAWHEILGKITKEIILKSDTDLTDVNYTFEKITSITPKWY